MVSGNTSEFSQAKLDVVVITARSEENEAVRRCFDRASERVEGADDRKIKIPQYVFAANGSNAQRVRVGLVHCGEMGNVAAAAKTSHVIGKYHPSVAIFAGIAGALDPQDTRIGDVFIPSKVNTRFYNKLKQLNDGVYDGLLPDEKRETIFEQLCRLECHTDSIHLPSEAQTFLGMIDRHEVSSHLSDLELPDEVKKKFPKQARKPRVSHEEESFCWDKVISSKAYSEFLKGKYFRAAQFVEMESYGFLRSVKGMQEAGYATQGIVVRSISDYATDKYLTDGDSRWRDLAKENMAIATYRLITTTFPKVYPAE